jgi:hypothetical protein
MIGLGKVNPARHEIALTYEVEVVLADVVQGRGDRPESDRALRIYLASAVRPMFGKYGGGVLVARDSPCVDIIGNVELSNRQAQQLVELRPTGTVICAGRAHREHTFGALAGVVWLFAMRQH